MHAGYDHYTLDPYRQDQVSALRAEALASWSRNRVTEQVAVPAQSARQTTTYRADTASVEARNIIQYSPRNVLGDFVAVKDGQRLSPRATLR